MIQACSSCHDWQEIEVKSSSSDNLYLVQVPPWTRYPEDVICSCPGYSFRGKCRHQSETFSNLCFWNELYGIKQTDHQKKNKICPECGSKTVLVEEK